LANNNQLIHGLWIGKYLSSIELLCISSFIANGHEFHLWVYNVIDSPLPNGVILENASDIIHMEKVFCYKYSNQFGHGKGSYAGFSDIFRYKLLYKHGGWWVDMDVVCLKYFNFTEPYVFRTHHDFQVVGNIMKCGKNSEIMRLCYEKASQQVDENNTDWNLPIRILNETIKDLHLINYIHNISNPDSWWYVRKLLLYRKCKISQHWYALHLINEEWRHNRINKKAIPENSYLGSILKKYGLWEYSPWNQRLINIMRLIFMRFSFLQIIGLLRKILWKMIRLVKKTNND
jgi:mannosyltransferase OCH1-like enzyme